MTRHARPLLLTVDRGNTSLDVMLHSAPVKRWRAPAHAPETVLAEVATLAGVPVRAVASTVVAGGLTALEAVLADAGVRLEVAGRDLPCPLPLAYADPNELGTDRWLAALAAFAAHGAAVVVQCGTAITADAVDASGRFLGGAIAPGLRAMAAGLAAAAPALPPFAGGDAIAVPATSSRACVDAGVHFAFCGAVERLVEDVARALPGGAPRLLTGGDARAYLRHGRLSFVHVPDLVHQGLRCLAERCAPRS